MHPSNDLHSSGVATPPTGGDRPLVIRMGSREGIIYRISPESIWIGHAGEGHDFTPLLDLGIEAMIELAEEEPSFPTRRDLISCRFPLIDGVGNRPELLALAIRTVAILIAAGIPTLVCCSDGLSRRRPSSRRRWRWSIASRWRTASSGSPGTTLATS